jgi:hypothetical protein
MNHDVDMIFFLFTSTIMVDTIGVCLVARNHFGHPVIIARFVLHVNWIFMCTSFGLPTVFSPTSEENATPNVWLPEFAFLVKCLSLGYM